MPDPQFAKGAIRAPTDSALLFYLGELERDFPVARSHREAFRGLGSEFVYARRVQELPGSWIALVRFGLAVETMFGLTREVAILYSPHKDLQIRLYHAIPAALASLPRQATQGIVFVSTPDPRQEQKLDDWSDLRLTGIPLPQEFPSHKLPDQVLLSTVERRLFTRDLYAETSPVTGAAFFGRQILLQSVMDDVKSRRVAGLFGLRKSGKTSILKRLADLLEEESDPRYIFVLRDLESLPSIPREVVKPLVSELQEGILSQLRQHDLRTRELAEYADLDDLLGFKRALQTLLRKSGPATLQLVVALDEIEYLCPPNQLSLETFETQEIPQFFGILRSLVQETPNFTFLIAGLASAAVEAGTLFGRHNPLFSWAKTYYVPPFLPEEASQLLRELGRRMGVRWQINAEDEVYSQTGGHPFLLRDLASHVTRKLPLNATARHVSRGDVSRQVPGWRRSVAGNIGEMLAHIGRYYPSEQILLDYLLEDEASFNTLVEESPQEIHHLLMLGLVSEVRPGIYRPSNLLRSEST